ncbi:hypothetical protein BDZ97DRAFT_1929745 [Flammula alnicola]|nr:hypothetical protein BDZ97DRAFT_1929745 [Flammula alnicola]
MNSTRLKELRAPGLPDHNLSTQTHPQAVPVHQTTQPLPSSTTPVSPPVPIPPALTPPPWHPLSLVASASTYVAVPQLIPDLSSESDESDEFSSLVFASSSSYRYGYAHAHGAESHSNHNSSMNGYTNAYTPCDDIDNDGAHLRYKAYVTSCHPSR